MINLPSPVIAREAPGSVTYQGGVTVLGTAMLEIRGRTFTADQIDEAKVVAAGLLDAIARLEAAQPRTHWTPAHVWRRFVAWADEHPVALWLLLSMVMLAGAVVLAAGIAADIAQCVRPGT